MIGTVCLGALIFLFVDRPGHWEATGHPCARSVDKETSWAVLRFFGIAQRVAIVVALTGEDL